MDADEASEELQEGFHQILRQTSRFCLSLGEKKHSLNLEEEKTETFRDVKKRRSREEEEGWGGGAGGGGVQRSSPEKNSR